MSPEDIREMKRSRRTLAKLRFRSLIRKVMLNAKWLAELEDQKLGDNVRRNVAIIVRRKGVKGLLSLADKRILNTPFENRSLKDREKILEVFTGLKCLERYPPILRSRLSKSTYFLYYNRGRTIVKEGQHASALYFILDGEITVLQRQWVATENQFMDTPVGAMGPGDMFGEVALLYNTKRTATCQTATDCELLCVYSQEFDKILRTTLKTQWDQILISLKRFEYFKHWTPNQIRECCVLSRIKQYSQQETIYSEDKGSKGVHYAHFVLSGNCMILQGLEINTTISNGIKKYYLEDIEKAKSKSEEIIEKLRNSVDNLQKNPKLTIARINRFSGQEDNLPNEIIENLSNYNVDKTETKPNEINENLSSSNRESETKSQSNFKSTSNSFRIHRFVDAGTFSCGSVFGLGENMEHRTIVARNQVQCLLIPKYWLFQKAQNIGNIWYRTQMYLDASIPSRLQLFDDFIATNKWKKYKKKVISDITSLKINRNPTKLRDVPIICRIEEGF